MQHLRTQDSGLVSRPPTISTVSDLLRAHAYEWNPFAMPWMVLGVVLLALCGVIFARQRSSRVAVLFCAMITLVAIWFLALAAMFQARDAGDAEAWARVAFAAVCILPAA